ncbi:MAG: hypothetical protein HC789_00970 [Microcoleus sp. CSU_2_2]|nr:hypothetical protein [Microcoleus sp. SU_5_3]NJS09034.1 hypothetical protein [Microcoleus sp. CSU_2_2]
MQRRPRLLFFDRRYEYFTRIITLLLVSSSARLLLPSYACEITDGRNPHLTRLSSHAKGRVIPRGIPCCLANFYLQASRNSSFLAAKNKYVPLYRQSFYQLRIDRWRAFWKTNICQNLAFLSLLTHKKVNLAKS